MRITTENRTRLETVIPLATPYVIFIDPANVCNQKCSYCPTGHPDLLKDTARRPTVMDFRLYEQILYQCEDFPDKIKTLRLYKDGEPLLNPNFADMIAYAKDAGKFIQIDTTTNGLLLNQEVNKQIVHAGLDRINISVPKGYDSEYLANVADLFVTAFDGMHIFAKIAGDYLTEDERHRFLEDFRPITHDCAIEHTAPCWPGFDVDQINLDVGVYGQPLQGEPQVCPYIFYQMAVNADGTVSRCFLDWSYRHIMGNLRSEHIMDVWNGRIFSVLREDNLRMLRHCLMSCCDCQQLKYGMPDNIDPYAEELLRRMK
jgi:MoaA/NifB/PqqE/SkfB family radical SAM enzyme